jgi:NAD(P)H-dependent flavin oxidoreductase YrpB (nitropropane dioxygenase family)
VSQNLFELPKLIISKNLPAIKPIVQGGMAIKISTAKLAAAIANCGGLGIIAATGLTREELIAQIREARELQKNNNGLIGINIMFAASDFTMLVKTAIEEGIDLVVFGAGFSRDVFSLGKESGTPIVPIVSSAKLAVISKKLGASSIILESGEAGGHLGTDKSTTQLIAEVKEALDSIPDVPDVGKVSLIAAGGAINGCDIANLMKLGVNGVQMGTRFVMSKECEVSEKFKQLYLNIKESDVVKILSPVGLQARAILNDFCKRILDGTVEKPECCDSCLKHCSRSFCIKKAMHRGERGDIINGLVFAGKNVCKIKDILSVKEIFENLEREFQICFSAK